MSDPKFSQHLRQGDTLLVKIPAPANPGEPVARGRIVVAAGESTGHAHVLEGAVAEFVVDGQRVIWIESPTPYIHDEHHPIPVYPGWYVVPQQVEYHPETLRRVTD